MGFRYYDPLVGRFIQRDPLGAGYEYAYDDPISYYDPTGQVAILVVVAILIIVGVTAAVVTYAIPQTRPYLDAAMTAIGFIPFFGDILSSAYFLTQDAIDCAQGRCDPVNIGLDVIGAVPAVPNLGGGARTASRALGFLGGIGIIGRTEHRIEGGFSSFRAFKRFFGKVRETYEWHHVVEQNWRNTRRFGAQRIHNVENLVALPHGLHVKISAYYSSVREFSEGMTVRRWLHSRSFEEQYEFGWEILERALRGEI